MTTKITKQTKSECGASAIFSDNTFCYTEFNTTTQAEFSKRGESHK